MKIATIALRNIFRNKRRSLLSLSAIAVAALAIVMMNAFVEGIKYDSRTTVLEYTTGQARLRNPHYEPASASPLQAGITEYPALDKLLSGLTEVGYVAPRIQFKMQVGINRETLKVGNKVLYMFPETRVALGLGLDFEREKEYLKLSRYIVPGGRLPGPGEVLLGASLAQRLKLKTGDELTVFFSTAQDESDSAKLIVSGLVALPLQQYSDTTILLPLATAQEMLRMDNSVLESLIFFRNEKLEENIGAVHNALERAGRNDLVLTPWTAIGNLAELLNVYDYAFNFIALFFFILGTTVIINTTMMVILERMREIGTLRAMGMTGRELVLLFFFEALFISLAASAAGVICGTLLVLPLSITGLDLGKFVDLGKVGFTVSNVLYPQLTWHSTLFVFVYSTAVASLVSFIPSRRASKIEPVEALRSL